jgi:hypothetical protein
MLPLPELPKLLPSPSKEGRYWPYELFIVTLLTIGSFVVAWGFPHVIGRSTNWFTLFFGAIEAIAAAAAFYVARLNATRLVAATVFAAGAIIFYTGFNGVY